MLATNGALAPVSRALGQLQHAIGTADHVMTGKDPGVSAAMKANVAMLIASPGSVLLQKKHSVNQHQEDEDADEEDVEDP